MAKRKSKGWQSRIVRHGEEQAGQLLANPENWRIHPTAQQEAIRGVIGGEVGWVDSVKVNLRTGREWPVGKRGVETIIDGHLRVQEALRQGEDTMVPVTYVDLSPAEERIVLATFDPIGAMAATDSEKLDELVNDLETSLDIDAILAGQTKPPKTKAKGLRHELKRCECCADGKCTDPDCGCYREPE